MMKRFTTPSRSARCSTFITGGLMPAASMRCPMRRIAWAGNGRLAQAMSESSGSDPALSQSLSENGGLRMIVPPVEPVILDDLHALETETARGSFDRTALEVP